MTDQCQHCTVRGDFAACQQTKCGIHENWYAEQLRKRVKDLEARLEFDPEHGWDGIACRDETIKGLDQQLTELRKSQGEPVAVVNVKGGGTNPIVSWIRPGELPAGSHKLYTSAPSIPEEWQIVPKEPTSEMMQAACESIMWYEREVTARAVHRAMLAAAPMPKPTD